MDGLQIAGNGVSSDPYRPEQPDEIDGIASKTAAMIEGMRRPVSGAPIRLACGTSDC